MTQDPTRPDVEERYARSVESSDLSVKPQRGPVDYLVAAGWCADNLGAALFRLRTEWDTVSAELRQAETNARDGAREATRMARAAYSDATREDADLAKKQVEAAALTARALVLAHLKTLASTRQAVYAYAIAHGTRQRFYSLPAIRVITGRALQLWLDPNCPHCEGRGFVGGFREPVRWCQECIHTGKRINGRPGFRLGSTEAEHQFGRSLLVEMDRKAALALANMRKFLHGAHTAAAKLGEADAQAIQARLQGLRSTEAERD